MEVVQSVHDYLRQRIQEHKDSRDPEPLAVTAGEVSGVLLNCGVPEARVEAFQSACGLVNLVTPTAAVVMGALALGRIPYEKWLKFVWKLMLLFLLLTGLLLVLAAALS